MALPGVDQLQNQQAAAQSAAAAQAAADANAAAVMWTYTRGEAGFPYWAWGYVVDAASGAPVSYPHIQVIDPSNGRIADQEYIGDAGGVWNLGLPTGDYYLSITAAGYKTYTQPAKAVSGGYHLSMDALPDGGVNVPVQVPGVQYGNPSVDWTRTNGLPGFPVYVSGYVNDALTGKPVAATLTVLKPDGSQFGSVYSIGAGGDFGIGLPSGDYVLQFTAAGYGVYKIAAAQFQDGSHLSMMPGGGPGATITLPDGTASVVTDANAGSDNTTMYLLLGGAALLLIGIKKGWFKSRPQKRIVYHVKVKKRSHDLK